MSTLFTTFTCQAAVRRNETIGSDVIVPFGLHVYKSFTCDDASGNISCAGLCAKRGMVYKGMCTVDVSLTL